MSGALQVSQQSRTVDQDPGAIKLTTFVRRFLKDESGVIAIEYGLRTAGIAIVILTDVKNVGSNLKTFVNCGQMLAVPGRANRRPSRQVEDLCLIMAAVNSAARSETMICRHKSPRHQLPTRGSRHA
jgi:pilus assembly protein Flp/PilA